MSTGQTKNEAELKEIFKLDFGANSLATPGILTMKRPDPSDTDTEDIKYKEQLKLDCVCNPVLRNVDKLETGHGGVKGDGGEELPSILESLDRPSVHAAYLGPTIELQEKELLAPVESHQRFVIASNQFLKHENHIPGFNFSIKVADPFVKASCVDMKALLRELETRDYVLHEVMNEREKKKEEFEMDDFLARNRPESGSLIQSITYLLDVTDYPSYDGCIVHKAQSDATQEVVGWLIQINLRYHSARSEPSTLILFSDKPLMILGCSKYYQDYCLPEDFKDERRLKLSDPIPEGTRLQFFESYPPPYKTQLYHGNVLFHAVTKVHKEAEKKGEKKKGGKGGKGEKGTDFSGTGGKLPPVLKPELVLSANAFKVSELLYGPKENLITLMYTKDPVDTSITYDNENMLRMYFEAQMQVMVQSDH